MHGTDQIDTGIIDQDVDPTSAAAYLFDAGLDRSVVSDIEQHELDAGERTSRRGGTDAAERPEALGGQQFGGCPADAGRCTGDQDNAP
jgi:hypothetical protein